MTTQTSPVPVQPLRRTIRVTVRFLQFSIALLIAGIVRFYWLNHREAATPHAVTNSGADDTIAILACTWGGIGIPLCLWLIWMYRRSARRAGEILSGANRIAQWSCSPDEWGRFLLIVAKRSKKSLKLIFIIFAASGVIMFGVAIVTLATMKPPERLQRRQWSLA